MSKLLARSIVLAAACVLALAATATAQTRALFSSQQLGSTGLQQFSINLDTGALTQQGSIVPSGSIPTVPSISGDGRHIYVGAFNDNKIHGFSITPGGLTTISGSPFSTGSGPNEAVVNTGRGSLWTANTNDGTISAYSVHSDTGVLTEAAGSPFPGGGDLNAIAVSSFESFIYGSGYGGNVLAGVQIFPAPNLVGISGFPAAHPGTPADVEFDYTNNRLFVANNGTDSVSSYVINTTTGALSEIPGSPFSTGDGPAALAASPDGQWLFVVDGNATNLEAFHIETDGTLTPAGNPVGTGGNPFDVTVTPDSRFAYVSNYNDGTISGYSIGANGQPTELSGSPFGDGSGAVASVAIVPDQGPIASFSTTSKDNTVNFDASASHDPDGSIATYAWNFGDGTYLSTSSPTISHTYPEAIPYGAQLVVIDNENCSSYIIGTGQTIACNGSALAVQTISVTPAGPLTLKHATGKQLTSLKKAGKSVRRVQIEFFLNRDAKVSSQFQRSTSKGRCRKATTNKPGGKTTYKNFGKKTSTPGTGGRNRNTFVGDFGGRSIVPGRYRVKLTASDSSSSQTPTTTSASFCVR